MRPPRGTCVDCAHPVILAQTDDNARLLLEVHESAGGPGRYEIWDDGSIHPVSAGADVLAHEIHLCETENRRS